MAQSINQLSVLQYFKLCISSQTGGSVLSLDKLSFNVSGFKAKVDSFITATVRQKKALNFHGKPTAE